MDELLMALSVTGFKTKFKDNALSIVYDEASRPYLEKILLDLFNVKGYHIRLAASNGHGEVLFGFNDKAGDIEMLARNFKDALVSYDANINYREKFSDKMEQVYKMFLNCLKLGGKFGIGIQN